MEFSTARELWEKGKVGDTTVIDGKTWTQTGEGIGDILMTFEESELPRVDPEPSDKAYIVWNQARNEGFVTTDAQLAYEVRKSSESNCFDENGRQSTVGQAFCHAWGDEDCTIQEIEIPTPAIIFSEGRLLPVDKRMEEASRYLNRWKAENELCNHPTYHEDGTASFCMKTKGHNGPHHPGSE